MSRRLSLCVSLAALVVVTGCHSCGTRDHKADPRDGLMEPPIDKAPLELSPLPQAPDIHVDADSVMGIASGPLTVVVMRPQGELKGNQHPSITFNKPVVALGALSESVPVPATIAPNVPGEWRWLGSSSAEFVPTDPLPWSTEFTVTVNPQLAAVDGHRRRQVLVAHFGEFDAEMIG